MKAPTNAHWYDVPAGTRPSQCRGESCKATIYWIITPKGRKCPVDCEVDGGNAPSESALACRDVNSPGRASRFFAMRHYRGVQHTTS